MIGHALSSKEGGADVLMCTLFQKSVHSRVLRVLSGFIFQSNCLISRMCLSLHVSAVKTISYCYNMEYFQSPQKQKFSSRNKNFLLLEFSLDF